MAKVAEPQFGPHLNDWNLLKALNWYHINRSELDARKYLHAYVKSNINSKLTIHDISKWNYLMTDGWVARLLSTGVSLPERSQETNFRQSLYKYMAEAVELEKNEKKKKVEDIPKPKKRQEIKEGILGQLEFEVDEFTGAKCKNDFDPSKFLMAHNVMRKDCTDIKRWAKSNFHHMADVIAIKPDKQLKEGYSNFSKPELKRLHKFYQNIYQSADKYMRARVKPRKVKTNNKVSVTQTSLEAHLSKL